MVGLSADLRTYRLPDGRDLVDD